MAQKTNPIIFQLKKTNNWKSKYIEKKTSEFSIYSKQTIEIKNFIIKFFEKYSMAIHNCKFYYLAKSIHVYLSYDTYWNKHSKYYKTLEKNVKNWKKEFFFSLAQYKCKKYKFLIVLERLNIKIKQILLYTKIKKLCKKNLINLRKYNLPFNILKKKNNFFNAGINIIFNCITNKKCAQLLAHFIIIQLKILDRLKRHNFFLNFIKNALKLFKNNNYSKFKGIKIKIKGRLNGRPRAKSKIIIIGRNIPVITMDSIIDYSNKTAFTANGTLGVKIWIYEI